MAERRIFIDENYVDFVRELSDSDSDNKIFDSMAQCLVFAASYGYKHKKRRVVTRAPTSKVDPINLNIFANQGIDSMFDMLAMATEEDKSILRDNDESFDKRAVIFEEYAKGGLALLKKNISGKVDYLDALVELTVNASTKVDDSQDEHFDISQLLIN